MEQATSIGFLVNGTGVTYEEVLYHRMPLGSTFLNDSGLRETGPFASEPRDFRNLSLLLRQINGSK
jgi:hypothetical protein